MSYNRPYTFELANQLLTAAQDSGQDVAGYYGNAERNGVSRAELDRAAATLQRLAPEDFASWIRQEYIVDGWLHGYLDLSVDPANPELTTWVLGQLAEAHYRSGR